MQANKDETVPQTKYTVKGLKEEQIYEFRIAAENKAGVGPASDPTAPIQVKEPVGKYGIIIPRSSFSKVPSMKRTIKRSMNFNIKLCNYFVVHSWFRT